MDEDGDELRAAARSALCALAVWTLMCVAAVVVIVLICRAFGIEG